MSTTDRIDWSQCTDTALLYEMLNTPRTWEEGGEYWQIQARLEDLVPEATIATGPSIGADWPEPPF